MRQAIVGVVSCTLLLPTSSVFSTVFLAILASLTLLRKAFFCVHVTVLRQHVEFVRHNPFDAFEKIMMRKKRSQSTS